MCPWCAMVEAHVDPRGWPGRVELQPPPLGRRLDRRHVDLSSLLIVVLNAVFWWQLSPSTVPPEPERQLTSPPLPPINLTREEGLSLAGLCLFCPALVAFSAPPSLLFIDYIPLLRGASLEKGHWSSARCFLTLVSHTQSCSCNLPFSLDFGLFSSSSLRLVVANIKCASVPTLNGYHVFTYITVFDHPTFRCVIAVSRRRCLVTPKVGDRNAPGRKPISHSPLPSSIEYRVYCSPPCI